MSAQNKQTVEDLYAAFGRGDIPSILGLFHPEIEWWEAESFVYADKNPYRGPQAILSGLFARLAGEWEKFKAIPDEVLDAGETVVSCGHYTGKYLVTDCEVRAQFAHVFKFQDGKIVRFQQYTDTAQFEKAVSMSDITD
ncbi:MAG TPA: nuclear transport factor 2 family protein [Pyrinomonadaceae bacterium]|nr:nuclear transport factor 2 family protein [Pyrinomonadaceae bacterium]